MDENPKSVKPGKQRLITRRRLLVAGGAVLATGAAASGGFLIWDYRKRFGREALRVIADHRVALADSVPKMVICRGIDPALNVKAALDRMGGLGRFIDGNDVVVVKPNIGWQAMPEQGATTHPEIVAAVVRACREVGPKRLIVCDCPVSEARGAFERSGIMQAALEAGAEVILPEESRYHTVQVSPRLGTWDVLEPFVPRPVPSAPRGGSASSDSGQSLHVGVYPRPSGSHKRRL